MIGVYGAGTDWDRLKGQVIKFYHKWPLGRFPFLNSYFYDGYNIWTIFRLNLAVKNEGSFAFQNFLKNIVFILLILARRKTAEVSFPNFKLVTADLKYIVHRWRPSIAALKFQPPKMSKNGKSTTFSDGTRERIFLQLKLDRLDSIKLRKNLFYEKYDIFLYGVVKNDPQMRWKR